MLRQWFVSLTLFTALFLLSGCLPATTPPSPASLFTRQGEPFTLRLGEKARLTDANLEISFATLVADGRCPTDALCAETAPVQVDVKVQRLGFSVGSLLHLEHHRDSLSLSQTPSLLAALARPDHLPRRRPHVPDRAGVVGLGKNRRRDANGRGPDLRPGA